MKKCNGNKISKREQLNCENKSHNSSVYAIGIELFTLVFKLYT